MEESISWSEWTGKRSAETAETLRKLRLQADESLNARRRHLSDLETELNHRIQQVASELAQELVETRDPEESNSPEKLLDQIDQLTSQIEQEAHLQDQLNQELLELKQERTELSQKQVQFQEEFQAQSEQLQQQQQRLSEQETEQVCLQETLQKVRAEAEQQAQLLSERDDILQTAQRESQEIQEDRDQLAHQLEQDQRKLELVLEDVQKLKLQNADLQETLSQHPEAEAKLSAELDSLRMERDALATRVGELEDVPPAVMDAEQQEEIADLRQRFEMAVDDVRQLKQENSQLQTQLETQLQTQQTSQAAPIDEGPLDWQAQKAIMLASLAAEEDGEPISEQRQQDLTTIEGALSVTDQVVAEKDQVIVDLRDQLATMQADLAREQQPIGEDQPSEQQAEEASRDALLTDDEIIQQERVRLEQLQQEWKDKLRQAELDISIERATLARDKAAMEEKLAAVEDLPPKDQKTNDQRPRRRWMAALGIKSDDGDE